MPFARMFAVARREYLERVRSRAFLIGTLLGPIIMAGLMLVPVLSRGSGPALRVAVVDATGTLQRPVEEALLRSRSGGQARFVIQRAPGGDPEAARATLREEVRQGRLDGYLYLPPDALQRSEAVYHGKNVSNVVDLRLAEQAVEEALVGHRLAAAGLDPTRVKDLTRKADLKMVRLSARGEREDRGGSVLLSLILMMLLYTTLFTWGAAIMNGVIEEKNNRVVEVMVSSLSPSALFAGKLAGVGTAGLTQFAIWGLTFGLIGLYAGAATGPLPEMPPLVLLSFPLFFLLGYFLYGSLYAAIGASVNTTQEAQGLVFPVMVPVIMALMFFPRVLASPDSPFAVTLSLVPFFAPLLMFLRITLVPPPAWQIALCVALMLVTITAVVFAAARVYRVGILMYGKRPTLPEILRWVRSA